MTERLVTSHAEDEERGLENVLRPQTLEEYVGQEKMKKALILNAINPQVGGVLVRGEKGTGKSTAVRALAELISSGD